MSSPKFHSTIASVILVLASACNMQQGSSSVKPPSEEHPSQSTSGESTTITTAPSVAPGEQIFPVELIARPGTLLGHGPEEEEYQDLTPGSASLHSGTYLKTLDNGAFVILPEGSVLRMDVNTEVQLGMYENGTMIWQHSGRTYHFVMPNKLNIYEVRTPFGTLQAHGTDFEVRVDYPAEGWVVVYWGEVGVVEVQDIVDPITGLVIGTRNIYGLVPENAVLLGPDGSAESWSLQPGDTLEFVVDPVTGEVVASPGSPRSNDDWSIRNDQIAEVIRQLMLNCQAGIYTREQCREQYNDLMQQAMGLAENEPAIPRDVTPVIHLGKLWAGMLGDSEVVTFCFDGRYISMIHWVTAMQALTLDTGEVWSKSAVFNIDDALVAVNDRGHFQLIYQVENPLWPNFGILFEGTIGGGGGEVLLNGQGLTEVEHSWTEYEYFQVQATPSDCTY